MEHIICNLQPILKHLYESEKYIYWKIDLGLQYVVNTASYSQENSFRIEHLHIENVFLFQNMAHYLK